MKKQKVKQELISRTGIKTKKYSNKTLILPQMCMKKRAKQNFGPNLAIPGR